MLTIYASTQHTPYPSLSTQPPAHLVNKDLQATSISAYLLAFRHLQIEVGMVPPARCEWPQLQYVLRGIKLTQSTQPQGTRQHLPITIDIMGRLQATIFSPQVQWSDYDKTIVWAACCMGFFGFIRSGEFTSTRQGSAITITNVAVESHTEPVSGIGGCRPRLKAWAGLKFEEKNFN